nr:MAG TPA: hypothetical protein [Caudoviricetes sp.]
MLTQATGRAFSSVSSLVGRGDNMVTYSDLFNFVIMLCAVIALILTHKK